MLFGFSSVKAILDANARGHKLLIMDARPKINALANQVNKTTVFTYYMQPQVKV